MKGGVLTKKPSKKACALRRTATRTGGMMGKTGRKDQTEEWNFHKEKTKKGRLVQNRE